MMVTNSLSAFHQWLLAQPDEFASSRTIVLHGGPQVASDPLIEEIAAYLNEYDDEGAGRWLPATSELVAQVSQNPDSRRLLAMADPCPNCPPTGPCGIGKALTAFGRRGYVVFRSVTPADKTLELPDAFHAGIGDGIGKGLKCHLVLNPELMQPQSIAHIVSDVFLDWRHEETRLDSVDSTRNALSSAIQDQT